MGETGKGRRKPRVGTGKPGSYLRQQDRDGRFPHFDVTKAGIRWKINTSHGKKELKQGAMKGSEDSQTYSCTNLRTGFISAKFVTL